VGDPGLCRARQIFDEQIRVFDVLQGGYAESESEAERDSLAIEAERLWLRRRPDAEKVSRVGRLQKRARNLERAKLARQGDVRALEGRLQAELEDARRRQRREEEERRKRRAFQRSMGGRKKQFGCGGSKAIAEERIARRIAGQARRVRGSGDRGEVKEWVRSDGEVTVEGAESRAIGAGVAAERNGQTAGAVEQSEGQIADEDVGSDLEIPGVEDSEG
jgi:hypothetical protein